MALDSSLAGETGCFVWAGEEEDNQHLLLPNMCIVVNTLRWLGAVAYACNAKGGQGRQIT